MIEHLILSYLESQPLSQNKTKQDIPRLQGNTIGGLVGVVVHDALTLLGLGSYVWLASALAVSLTMAQEVTRTVHPPGRVRKDEKRSQVDIT